MAMTQRLFVWLLALVLLQACEDKSILKQQIGVIWDDISYPSHYMDPAIAWLDRHENFELKIIALSEIRQSLANPENTPVIWYHKPINDKEHGFNQDLKGFLEDYLEQGGNLLLTMQAVELSHTLGWQKTPTERVAVEIKDNGFGRNYGFHGYLSHPIYNGLQNGAYTWHPREDAEFPRIGYFSGKFPTDADILGIQWSYITFNEEEALVWLQNIKDGKVMHVGAFIYPGEDQFNRSQHDRFLSNCLQYLSGKEFEQKEGVWPDPNGEVIQLPAKSIGINAAKPLHWELPISHLEMVKEKPENTLWNVAGRRMLWLGKERGGIDEVWAHPILGMRDLSFGLKLKGKDEVLWMDEAATRYYSRAESIVREYDLKGMKLRDIVVSSATMPVGVWHLEWDGHAIEQIFVRVNTRLRLMWPYSERVPGSLHYSWSEVDHLLHVKDPDENFHTLIGFNHPPAVSFSGRYRQAEYNKGLILEPTEEVMVAGAWVFDVDSSGALDIILASGEGHQDEFFYAYQHAIAAPSEFIQEALDYYQGLSDRYLMIESPDENFNKGYEWALVNTDKFMVETPGIGTTLMAGFSSTDFGWNGRHRISGRPGYAWYFGRDAAWSGFALNGYGDFESVKKVLEAFQTYQYINGKIFHELTSSKVAHFDAADATPLYIILMAHYIKYSGDMAFLKESEPYLRKAMTYLEGTDTDGDGFIENTNEGHGWVEGGPLYGAHTTFYLAGNWVATLRDYAQIMNWLGDHRSSRKYESLAELRRKQLNQRFWNEERQFFNYGLWIDGSYNTERTVLPAVNVYLDVIDADKAALVASQYAFNNFTTDWGVRLLGEESPKYNPRGYHYGSVWPLYTGWASLAEYATGHYQQGFTHIMHNLNVYKQWDLGAVEEVLHGEIYRPSGVSRQQCWSETMVLQPVSEGMLGLKANAPEYTLQISPRLPWNWAEARLRNIRLGDAYLDIKFKREEDVLSYEFTKRGKGKMKVRFAPTLPLGSHVESVSINGIAIKFEVINEPQAVMLRLPEFEPSSNDKLIIESKGGFGYLAQEFDPQPEQTTNTFRVIGESLKKTWEIEVEGNPNSLHTFYVYSAVPIKQIEDAEFEQESEGIYQIRVRFGAPADSKYLRKTLKVTHAENQ
jgi:glycogen debranching enzyme